MAQKIVAVRIDSRLIHGQTASLWTGYWNADRFILIDDATANDPTMKSVMRMATPGAVRLSCLTCEKAVEYLSDPTHYENEKITIIVSDLTPLIKLIEAGVKFDCDYIVVGQMVQGEGRDKEILRHIRVSENDIKNFHRLDELGVKMYLQTAPTDAVKEFMPLLKTVE